MTTKRETRNTSPHTRAHPGQLIQYNRPLIRTVPLRAVLIKKALPLLLFTVGFAAFGAQPAEARSTEVAKPMLHRAGGRFHNATLAYGSFTGAWTFWGYSGVVWFPDSRIGRDSRVCA